MTNTQVIANLWNEFRHAIDSAYADKAPLITGQED